MSFNNIIAIVGDKFNAINLISSKLVLLRDLDKVVDTNLENAVAFLSQTMPNVIVIHAKGDSEESLDTIKQIKKDNLLCNIPILLYAEECTKEFLIDAFDSGVSDIIKTPVEDWELLIRVIWCIQKNEITLNTNSKNNFLINLGIIQDGTGFYTEQYAEQFLNTEIDSSVKYKNSACLMLVGPDDKFPPISNAKVLNDVIKKSIRLNDAVGIRKDGKYYIYLPKTKLNGAYAVFERINNNLGLDLSVNVSVAEIKEEGFEDVKQILEITFEKTKGTSGTLLVAHKNAIDSIPEPKETPQSPMQLKQPNIIEKRINLKEKFNSEHTFKKPDSEGSFTNDTLFRLEDKTEENIYKPEIPARPIKEDSFGERFPRKRPNPVLPNVEIGELSEEDERNANLFRHAFKKKCELVTNPVFDKFKLKVENQNLGIDVNKKVDFNQSYFELRREDKMLRLTVNYPGFSKVDIITEIFFGTEKKGYNAFSLDLTEYSFHKLSITLEGLIDEYESYL